MPRLIDLTGKRFGRLTVISKTTPKRRSTRWLCRCDCGKEVVATSTNLRNGNTKSCGCYIRDLVTERNTTHGLSKNRLYSIWHSMKDRCLNPNHPHFKDYGGRGIAICNEWRDNFKSFYEWANAHGYDEKAHQWQCTLDRTDTNGNYCPENCRWVDMKTQIHNRRNSSARRQ